MPRAHSSFLAALFAAIPLLAAPPTPVLSVGGAVVDALDRPVAGAAVELIPVVPPAEEHRLEEAGRALAEPIASTRTDAAGLFTLAAPGSGMYQVVVRASGSVPVAHLLAAVEDVELPPARLSRDAGVSLRVLDAGGRPVAGARVFAERSRRDLRFSIDSTWRPAPRLGLTGADGRIALPRAEKEPLRLQVLAAGPAPGELEVEPRQGTAELRLAAACPRGLEVRDAAGKPAEGVTVRSTVWSLGVTDAAGRLTVAAPCRGSLRLTLAAADGRTARLPLAPWTAPGEAPPVRASLPAAAPTWKGQVLEKETRRPLAGALVWTDDAPGAFARTDAHGAYTLLPAGSTEQGATVYAAAAGYFRASSQALPAGAAPALHLDPAAVVTGRVVDAAGQPVAGARLRAHAEGRDAWRAEGAGWAKSGADGRFRLSLFPRSPATLEARAAGFVDSSLPLAALPPHGKRTVEVVLSRGRSAFGQVVDGADRPVAGAEIVLSPLRDETAGASGPRRFSRPSVDPRLTTTTGADGRFTLSSLKAGRYDLSARAPGFAVTRVRGLPLGKEAAPADLGTVILQPGVQQAGIVVDDKNRPLAGATVRLWAEAGGGPGGRFRAGRDTAEQEVQAGPDGRFTLVDLTPAAPVQLAAEHPGFLAGERQRIAAPGENEVRLVLAAAALLSGRVVDEDGDPVSALVTVKSTAARPLNQFRDPLTYGVSDELGRFTFEALEPGRVEVAAQAERFLPSEPKGVELVAGRETEGVEIVVRPGAAIEGQVLAPGGRPVEGARVSLERKEEMNPFTSPGFNDMAFTDGDGRFSLAGVAPGAQTLVATHDRYLRGVRDVEARAGSTAHVEIRLGDGLSVSGRVVDASGAPLEGAGVSLTSRTESKNIEVWSEGDGSFRFTGLAPGEVSLFARKDGFTDARLGNLRLDGPLDGVELRLSRGGTIVGRITGLTYPELTQVQVMAWGESRPAQGQVDFEGSYRISGVAPGEWRVAAALPGTARSAQGKIEMPAAGAEVSLDLEFTGGLTLAGRVLQGGEPLPNASVSARGEGQGADAFFPGGSIYSDGAGNFRFEGLKPGTYRLGVYHRETGVRHQEKEAVELSESRADVVIDIPAATLVRGRVLEAGSQGPVAGATLFFDQEGEDPSSRPLPGGNAGETDSEGGFLVSAPPGRYRVTARKEGYSPGEARVEVAAGSSPPEVRIRLERASGLALEVVGLGGLPPAHVYAALVDGTGRPVVSGTYSPGEDGRIQLSQAPPGTFLALVRAPGTATASVPVSVPGGGARVALLPPAPLTVRVPALASDPQGGLLTLLNAEGQPFRSVGWSGTVRQHWGLSAGTAVIEDLPPGRYSLKVTTPGGKTWEGTAATSGEPATQVLE